MSLLSVGEKAASSEIIKELLCEENLDDDYQLYELLTKREEMSTGMQLSVFFTKRWIKTGDNCTAPRPTGPKAKFYANSLYTKVCPELGTYPKTFTEPYGTGFVFFSHN